MWGCSTCKETVWRAKCSNILPIIAVVFLQVCHLLAEARTSSPPRKWKKRKVSILGNLISTFTLHSVLKPRRRRLHCNAGFPIANRRRGVEGGRYT